MNGQRISYLLTVLISKDFVYDHSITSKQARDAAIAGVNEGRGRHDWKSVRVHRLHHKSIGYRSRITGRSSSAGHSSIVCDGSIIFEMTEEAEIIRREGPGSGRNGDITAIGIAHITCESIVHH